MKQTQQQTVAPYSTSGEVFNAHLQKATSDAVISSIGEGILATDAYGKISKVNAAALSILGYTEAELLGQWFPKVVGAYQADGTVIDLIDRPISKAMLSGKTVHDKTQYKTKQGSLVPVAISVSPILVDGRPMGAVEVFRDISLELKIDRMKSEFISLASHQLRTPLSAINSYVHMLDEGYRGDLSAAQKEYTAIIIQSIGRMNELINALLNVSKIEAGKMTVSTTTINVGNLVTGIVEEQRNSAQIKGVHVRVKMPIDDIKLESDPLLLREVYANLLSNAIKYTPAGGRVQVRLTSKDDHVIFTVRDTGYGIPVKQQAHIFTKFFRAENILDKDTTGSGLGLYMVKQIIDMLQGTLHFKSKEGAGSVFLCKLPLKRAATKPPASAL